MSTKNNIILATVVALVVGFLFGLGVSTPSRDDSQIETFRVEYETLRQAVQQQYPEYFNGEAELNRSGVVERVAQGSIIFTVEIPEVVLRAFDLSETVEISVNEGTLIFEHSPKSESEIAQEVTIYEEALSVYLRQLETLSQEEAAEFIAIGDGEPSYPDPVRQEEITLNEVEVGDFITVSTQSSDPILGLEGPSTTVITIQRNLVMETGMDPDLAPAQTVQ